MHRFIDKRSAEDYIEIEKEIWTDRIPQILIRLAQLFWRKNCACFIKTKPIGKLGMDKQKIKNSAIYQFLKKIKKSMEANSFSPFICKMNRLFGHNRVYSSWELNPYRGHWKWRGNKILLQNAIARNCKFYIYGQNNTIHLSPRCRLENCRMMIQGDNNEIFLDEGTFVAGGFWKCGGIGSQIHVGKNAYIGSVTMESSDGNRILLGDGCMLSPDVDIRNGEHPIMDSKTGEQINKAEDVVIGNHVWLGKKAIVLKGVICPDGCVLGECAIATKKYAPQKANAVYVGSPLRCVRENITWEF